MLQKTIDFVNGIVWSPALIVLLVGAGLYFSIRTRFVQVRRIRAMISILLGRHAPNSELKAGKVSSFEAFCLALSGRIGTGNIVGVATAIAMGGPGAVFWMWITAFLGSTTAFVESTLAQVYNFKTEDGWRGGPYCYIEKGLGQKWLGMVFAMMVILGYGLLLPQVQSNCIAAAFSNSFSVNPVITGIVVTALLFVVVLGGAKRISSFASIVTPFMAALYIIMSLIVVFSNIEAIPSMFALIFKSAFGAGPLFGGMIGSAIAFGVKRGLFSNEAGEGGGAIASASANVKYPAQQGLAQAFSVYVDTLLVCTSTALMILSTGKYNVFDGAGNVIVENAPELGNNFVSYSQAAIDTVFHGWGSIFITVSLLFFAFTTLMAYYFYAESSINYLFQGEVISKKMVMWIYRILMAAVIIYGSCVSANAAWEMGDIGVGITTWVNVIILLILSPVAFKELKILENRINARKQH